jgi:hypothetical protein
MQVTGIDRNMGWDLKRLDAALFLFVARGQSTIHRHKGRERVQEGRWTGLYWHDFGISRGVMVTRPQPFETEKSLCSKGQWWHSGSMIATGARRGFSGQERVSVASCELQGLKSMIRAHAQQN